jgi:hypothetical protein
MDGWAAGHLEQQVLVGLDWLIVEVSRDSLEVSWSIPARHSSLFLLRMSKP